MKKIASAMAVAALVTVAGCATNGNPTTNVAGDKVIYHINEGKDQATDGLRNINNHLSVNPNARIVVVSHSRGVDFLMKGAADKNGNPYEIPVQALKAKGVRFEVCELTLKSRKMTKDQFIEEASFVPSGVAEVTKLQQREGYAYLKP